MQKEQIEYIEDNNNNNNNLINSNVLQIESLILENSNIYLNSYSDKEKEEEKNLLLLNPENFISKNFENFTKGKNV